MLGDRVYNTGGSSRSVVSGVHGMACTAHPLASLAANRVLMEGGNAVDAAIAANAVLGVVEPVGCGVGGDLFAIVRTKDGRTHGLNGSGRSASGLSLEGLTQLVQRMPVYGPLSTTVPGCCDGWMALKSRFGNPSHSMQQVLDHAIQIAMEGFPVTEVMARQWKDGFVNFSQHETEIGKSYLARARSLYLSSSEGLAPSPGDIFRNPTLAENLKVIAAEGSAGFYGRVLSAYGPFVREDFLAHVGSSEWVEPIQCSYRGSTRVFELPPNTQGIAALQMLRIMEGWDLAQMPLADVLHIMIESKRLAYRDLERHVGDNAKVEHLLDESYIVSLRAKIDMQRAMTQEQLLSGSSNSSSNSAANGSVNAKEPVDTTYLTVAHDGLLVSLIQSNYRGFGSGVVLPGCGFMLQNRGELFVVGPPGHPNCYAPSKRPFHTIIPAMMDMSPATESCISFGLMGGDMQAQGHAQMVHNMVDRGFNVQQAGDAPRWHHDGVRVSLESSLYKDAALVANLTARGHVIVAGEGANLFGGYQAIEARTNPHSSTGVVYFGGSDMRKDGCSIGY